MQEKMMVVNIVREQSSKAARIQGSKAARQQALAFTHRLQIYHTNLAHEEQLRGYT